MLRALTDFLCFPGPAIAGGEGNRKGTPQGGVISPLLANLYLHLLDRNRERRGVQQRLGARIIRYADDIVVLCRRGTDKPMEELRYLLERLELSLNETKTKTVNSFERGFDFLGFSIWMGKGRKKGVHYPHVQPSKKSRRAIKDRVTALTMRNRTPMPMDTIAGEINATVRGRVGYFHFRNCSRVLKHVKSHIEERLRTHLRKRHKIRDRKTGIIRFDNRSLYEHYGLYKVPTTAGWTKAHALR